MLGQARHGMARIGMVWKTIILAKGYEMKQETVELINLDKSVITVEIPISGTTSLISHKVSRYDIESLDGSKTHQKKDPRTNEQKYLDTMHLFDDGSYGFPAAAFKLAIVGACRQFSQPPMTVARTSIRVNGDLGTNLVKIIGEPRMREDFVRIQRSGAAIRIRAEFVKWNAVLNITFNKNSISPETLYNLVEAAGKFGGIGDWRPEHNGDHGLFMIDRSGEE